MEYVAAATVAINNRNVVLYLVEGVAVDLPEEEAAFLIAMGYLAAPEPPPTKPSMPFLKLACRSGCHWARP